MTIDSFDNTVVAITGAGSGIGRALAVAAADQGAHVALSDKNLERVQETAAIVGDASRVTARSDRKVTVTQLDVADRNAVFAWADQVASDHGEVNVIVNNAGVALVAPVETMEHTDFRWLMDINFWGVVHGTQAFLPHLKAAGTGHVVNISSVFGLVAVPSQSAYNAAKFAVRGFTDALRIELEVEPCGVSATTIHPGGIRTNIVNNARIDQNDPELRKTVADSFNRAARTTPERAATQILDAVLRNRRRALIGPDAVVFDAVSRLPAALSQRLLAFGARRELR